VDEEQPVPLRQLFVYPVVIAIANYTTLEFLDLCYSALLPLFLTMPIEIGGLGLDPIRIGYVMGSNTILNATFLGLFFSPITNRYGERSVFIVAISAYVGVYALFPIISQCAKWFGLSIGVWMGIVTMLCLNTISNMAFGCICMIIISVTPNKRSLGITNGLAQTTVSIARVLAPATATSMFSYSVERGILGGYGVYAVLFAMSCFAILLALRLPRKATSCNSMKVVGL